MNLLTKARDLAEYQRRWAQCPGKRQFVSRAHARKWANANGYGRQTPYVCPQCQYWHLTSKGD